MQLKRCTATVIQIRNLRWNTGTWYVTDWQWKVLQDRAALELSPRLISKLKKSCEISQYMQCTLHSLSPFNTPEETLSAVKMMYYAKLFIVLIYTL